MILYGERRVEVGTRNLIPMLGTASRWDSLASRKQNGCELGGSVDLSNHGRVSVRFGVLECNILLEPWFICYPNASFIRSLIMCVVC